MKRGIGLKVLVLCVGFVSFLSISSASGVEEAPFRIDPPVVIIGTTYHGSAVTVRGEVPRRAKAVVWITGHRQDTAFKKKGKALGLLWMNMDTVVFHNVPNLYLIFTDSDADIASLSMGFEALKKEISITPETEDRDVLFKEFLKLKTKEGLYSVTKGAIRYEQAPGPRKPFWCTVTLPAKLVPGKYEVHLAAINSGAVVALGKQILKAEEKGLPNLVASLAYRHATLYGILATVIAIIAGLIMGVVFKGGKGGH